MNTSLDHSHLAPNYCVLPSQHSHTFSASLLELLQDEREHSLLSATMLLAGERQMGLDGEESQQIGHEQFEGAGSAISELEAQQQQQQLLDPYIDAVQVRGRVNNKRGSRVKALPSPRDHEPNPSYYSKTVHVEELKEDSEEWDFSDSSEDEDDYDEKSGKHYHGGDLSKKKRKRVYVKKKYPHGMHHGGKRGQHAKWRGRKKPKGMKKKKKKVAYAYVYEPEGHKAGHSHYSHHHGHHDHYDKHDGHKHKAKLVHLDMVDKGKLSLAGLLGYTLLCVNYLLVLQQPTYDKHSGHYYTKYSPHGAKGDMVELKSGGPVILAHCGELPAPTSLARARLSSSGSELVERSNSSEVQPAAASYYATTGASDDNNDDTAIVYTSRRSPAASPPSYYYTLAPSSGSSLYSVGAEDYFGSRRSSGSFLSPIQDYLNRLLLPTSNPLANTDYEDYSPLRVVGGPQSVLRSQQRQRNSTGQPADGGQVSGRLVVSRQRILAGGGGGGGNRQQVVLVEGQPRVVGARDNLAELRTRTVDILVRVTRNRFSGAQRPMNIVEEGEWRWVPAGGQVPLAVRPPFELQPRGGELERENQMQADQPARQDNVEGGASSNSSSSSSSLGNNHILDLPEYALSGDSIELTCNHRIPVGRLYSVKWFKDSLEFYRFIPANGPRTKSSLFLPDVRLDLARSNSETLYLRNVTHRSSGLYRCEVVSGKWAGRGAAKLASSLSLAPKCAGPEASGRPKKR